MNYTSFLNKLINRCKLQPELRCAGCTQACVHMLTHQTCSLMPIRDWNPWQWTPWLCHALTYLWVFIRWVPQIMLTLPQVRKRGHFLWSERLKTFTLSAMCCCPTFFLFHRKALRFQPIRCKVRQTRKIVPTACQVKPFEPRTQLRSSLSYCLKQVCKVKVHPIKNKVCQTFFRFAKHPELGSQSNSPSNQEQALWARSQKRWF